LVPFNVLRLVHPLKRLFPICVTDEGIVIFVKPIHPWKALVARLITFEGINKFVKLVHSLNIKVPITEFNKLVPSNFVIPVHPWKALSPTYVTDDGIIILNKPPQLLKAFDPMLFKVEFTLNTTFDKTDVTEVNTLLDIDVTKFGITASVDNVESG
jgi:hypothetical protein